MSTNPQIWLLSKLRISGTYQKVSQDNKVTFFIASLTAYICNYYLPLINVMRGQCWTRSACCSRFCRQIWSYSSRNHAGDRNSNKPQPKMPSINCVCNRSSNNKGNTKRSIETHPNICQWLWPLTSKGFTLWSSLTSLTSLPSLMKLHTMV